MISPHTNTKLDRVISGIFDLNLNIAKYVYSFFSYKLCLFFVFVFSAFYVIRCKQPNDLLKRPIECANTKWWAECLLIFILCKITLEILAYLVITILLFWWVVLKFCCSTGNLGIKKCFCCFKLE